MLLGSMIMTGPCSQKPWHPVTHRRTFVSSPCLDNSSLTASMTAWEREAFQPVPPHTITVVVMFCRCSRSCSRKCSSSRKLLSLDILLILCLLAAEGLYQFTELPR